MNFKLVAIFLFAFVASSLSKDCSSLPDRGPCRGYYMLWAYEPSSGNCVSFIYGGCQGNGNRYDTKEQCEAACTFSN